MFLKNKFLYIGHYKIKCAIGKKGISKKKIEGDCCTPSGKFNFERLLYRKDRIKNLNVHIPKVQIKKNFGWCDDPTSKKYNELITDKRRPLINRVISGQYPPGSTLKPFVGLVALEEQIIDSTKLVNCDGAYELANHKRPFRCWKKEGHGDADLSYAITQSCDVFFYRVAQLTGIDTISENLYKYGFGQKTYLDLYGEKTGLIPDRKWKSKVKQLPWYQGETLNVGIGQGYFLATPMQLTLATSVLATDGISYTPHLLKRYINNKTKEIFNYNPEANKFITPLDDINDLDIVRKAMWRVVNEKNVGTASSLKKVKDIEFAGKTGTAQVYNLDAGKSDKKILQDHALFISYAPYELPEIVVTVIVEHGGGGSSTSLGDLTAVGSTLSAPTNADLTLAVAGTGNVVLTGLTFPNSDGSANQIIATNGSGVLSFVDAVSTNNVDGGTASSVYDASLTTIDGGTAA